MPDQSREKSEQSERSVLTARAVLVAVVGVLALIFVFQNHASRRIDFLFWSASMPAWIWLLVIFLAGAVVGSMFPWLRRRRD